MQNLFNRHRRSPAEQTLRRLRIPYLRQADGILLVQQDIIIPPIKLDRLYDFSNVVVDGNFSCAGNQLRTLCGAPKSVTGHFRCEHNDLQSCEGLPSRIGGDLVIFANRLKSMSGLSATVSGGVKCDFGFFASLDAVPLEYRPDVVAARAAAYQERIDRFLTIPKGEIVTGAHLDFGRLS